MTLEQFLQSLAHPKPPGAAAPLQALWHLGRKEWELAHALVQSENDHASAWVHAHLHRVEGDLANARYWYRRAEKPPSSAPLDDEWRSIAVALLRADG